MSALLRTADTRSAREEAYPGLKRVQTVMRVASDGAVTNQAELKSLKAKGCKQHKN